MTNQKQVKVVKLEVNEDLDLLVRGDAIERKDAASINEWETGAYHRINDMGHYEFLFPACMREEYITMDRVRKSAIRVVEGRIIYDRDRCAIESFSQSDSRYRDLNKTLQMAGLR